MEDYKYTSYVIDCIKAKPYLYNNIHELYKERVTLYKEHFAFIAATINALFNVKIN